MEKSEFRVLIKHCFLMGLNTVQAKQWLDKSYPGTAPSRQMVEKWFAKFKHGRTSTDDAGRSGRPNTAVTPPNVDRVAAIVLADRGLTLREIADAVQISEGSVHTILHDHLGMRKLCSAWVPRVLGAAQMGRRRDAAAACLAQFRCAGGAFLQRCIAVDQMWIHHFTPDESAAAAAPKRAKTTPAVGKVLATVFWDAGGIIFIDYLRQGTAFTDEHYADLLQRLSDEIATKRAQFAHQTVLLHQSNNAAAVHSDGGGGAIALAKIHELRFELLAHATDSPDLSPANLFLFPHLKKWLAGKRFADNEAVATAVDGYFQRLDAAHYKQAVDVCEERWAKCVELNGEYVEK